MKIVFLALLLTAFTVLSLPLAEALVGWWRSRRWDRALLRELSDDPWPSPRQLDRGPDGRPRVPFRLR